MALIYLCIYVDAKYSYFQHFQKASCKFDIYIQLTLPKKAQVNKYFLTPFDTIFPGFSPLTDHLQCKLLIWE